MIRKMMFLPLLFLLVASEQMLMETCLQRLELMGGKVIHRSEYLEIRQVAKNSVYGGRNITHAFYATCFYDDRFDTKNRINATMTISR